MRLKEKKLERIARRLKSSRRSISRKKCRKSQMSMGLRLTTVDPPALNVTLKTINRANLMIFNQTLKKRLLRSKNRELMTKASLQRISNQLQRRFSPKINLSNPPISLSLTLLLANLKSLNPKHQKRSKRSKTTSWPSRLVWIKKSPLSKGII